MAEKQTEEKWKIQNICVLRLLLLLEEQPEDMWKYEVVVRKMNGNRLCFRGVLWLAKKHFLHFFKCVLYLARLSH